MMDVVSLSGGRPLNGAVRVPGDKSISHRALIFNSLSSGTGRIRGLLQSEDVEATAQCLTQLGVMIGPEGVCGTNGVFMAPTAPLYCGNSGTSARLLMGLLAGQAFQVTFDGDASLQRRPMGRISDPLRALGARFQGQARQLPLVLEGGRLVNTALRSEVASAQVKTAILLAGLQGEGRLVFTEPRLSRDHSERMLEAMDVKLERVIHEDGSHTIILEGPQCLRAVDVDVPGDISSAAFFMVAAAITPGSDVTLEHVGINPTRDGVLRVLRDMGAHIEISRRQEVSGEPVADIRVKHGPLRAAQIGPDLIPHLVDEIPVLAVAMAHAKGQSSVTGAAELRVKESDRIRTTMDILTRLGCMPKEADDGFALDGIELAQMRPPTIDAHLDHRVAMSAIVAGLPLRGETIVSGASAVKSSFPNFMTLLEQLRE